MKVTRALNKKNIKERELYTLGISNPTLEGIFTSVKKRVKPGKTRGERGDR